MTCPPRPALFVRKAPEETRIRTRGDGALSHGDGRPSDHEGYICHLEEAHQALEKAGELCAHRRIEDENADRASAAPQSRSKTTRRASIAESEPSQRASGRVLPCTRRRCHGDDES